MLFLWVVIVLFASATAHADDDPIAQFDRKTESTLMAHRFAALDGMADDLRATNSRFPGGHSKLWHFYGYLAAFEDDACGCNQSDSETSFRDKQSAIAAWLTERPTSRAGLVVMAQFLINAASEARTGKWARDVTDAQWALYYKYLREANSYLEKVNPKSDPYVYFELMELAPRESNTRQRLDQLYAAAIGAFPEFFHYYADRADRLRPIWYGETGELGAYTRSLLHTPGGDEGAIAYSFVAGRIANLNATTPGGLFRDTGLSWPEVKNAYAVRQRHFGLRADDWNTLLFYAVNAGDFRAGAEFVDHIGDNWSPVYWRNAQGYAAVVKWARSATAGTQK